MSRRFPWPGSPALPAYPALPALLAAALASPLALAPPAFASHCLTAVSLSAGEGAHTLAVRAGGLIWGWGANQEGQLGDTSAPFKTVPDDVPGLSRMIAAAAGGFHSLGLREDGTVWSWGDNLRGQLGDGTTTDRAAAATVAGLSDVVAIAAGNRHSLALRGDGRVYAWGENADGQVGDGTTTHRSTPVVVNVPPTASVPLGVVAPRVVAIAAGENHSMALVATGEVYTWGARYGAPDDLTPTLVTGLPDIVAIDGADDHSLALASDGTVYTWGENTYGQLGDGTTTDRLAPGPVLEEVVTTFVTLVRVADGMKGVAGAGAQSYVLRSTGTMYAFGLGAFGTMGNGTTTTQNPWPRPISLSRVKQVDAGFAHGVALRSDGTVWAWGLNAVGQVGDGTTTTRLTPVEVGCGQQPG